jgi:hypothetical protein
MQAEQLYHGRRQLSVESQRCVGRKFRAGENEAWITDLSRLSFFWLGTRPPCRILHRCFSVLQNPEISRTNHKTVALRHIPLLSASHRLPHGQFHLPAFQNSISALGSGLTITNDRLLEGNANNTSQFNHVNAAIGAIDIGFHVF